jgi:hypothetical protein
MSDASHPRDEASISQSQGHSVPMAGMFGTWSSHRLAALHGAAPTPFMMNYRMAQMANTKSPSLNDSSPGTHQDEASNAAPESFRQADLPNIDLPPSAQLPNNTSYSMPRPSPAAPVASDSSQPVSAERLFPAWQAQPQSAVPIMDSRPPIPVGEAPPARNQPPQWRTITSSTPNQRGGGGAVRSGGQREWWEDMLCLEQLGCCASRGDRNFTRP